MKIAHVKFADPGYNFTTRINGTYDEVIEYYVGQQFQFGDTDEKPYDDMQTCIECIVEPLGE